MRQDLWERQKQIRRLHESIQKYQQSPNTKKAVHQATQELANAIQYKFRRSQVNKTYKFPKKTSVLINDEEYVSSDQYDSQQQIVDLKIQPDFLSKDLSIAEEPESNCVYVSQKTILMEEKLSPFSKNKPDLKSRLKIKVVKKKNDACYQTTSKLDRLKTEHIHTSNNFSTVSYKNQSYSKQTQYTQNDSTSSKSRIMIPSSSSDMNRVRRKLKIASRLENNQNSSSPISGNKNLTSTANLTMKTQYTHCTKRKNASNKQNQRTTINPHLYRSDKYYINNSNNTAHNSKKTQSSNCNYRLYLNVRGHKTNNNLNSVSANILNKKAKQKIKQRQQRTQQGLSQLLPALNKINLQNQQNPNQIIFINDSNFCLNSALTTGNTSNIANNKNNMNIPIRKSQTKINHRSFDNLKSIRLGNRSSQKIKAAKGLHA